MKMYFGLNVYEEAKKRVSYIFDQFQNICVSFSGGKDSTVVLNLVLDEARRRGRLPVKVLFIDQEAEWQHTVDYIKSVMYSPEVDPLWLQIPIRLFNCASHEQDWLHCWDPKAKDKWVHPQDPISIKENTFGTDRFHKMYAACLEQVFQGEPYANFGGVRAEEALIRFGGVTAHTCYKDITWGKREPKGYTFYPIYDWTLDDVWHYIAVSGVPYNGIYDLYFNYGLKARDMRVSNLHHETAWPTLFRLQEIERNTYNRLVNRLPGIATFSQMQKDGVFRQELPEMFSSWQEYRDYLLETIVRKDLKPKFEKLFRGQDGEDWAKEHVKEILLNDWEGTHNAATKSSMMIAKKKEKGGRFDTKYAISNFGANGNSA